MTHGNYSMSDKSYSGYGYNRSSGCGCGPYPQQGGCTLAAPQPYAACCHPQPLHRHSCQSSPFFPMAAAYGKY